MKRSGTLNQLLGVGLHTIAISELSRVRTELVPLLLEQMCTHILIIDFKLILHPLSKWSKLYGVEILNEGFGSSVDDSVLEMQATFIARTSLLKS